MKWHNLDIGEGYYYITGTVVEWLRLLEREDVRNAVLHEIKIALRRYRATLDVSRYPCPEIAGPTDRAAREATAPSAAASL